MDQGRRTTERKAVGLLVKLKHADIGSFVEEYAVNISPGGMFIRSREPQPVGTPVKFEVRIADGQRVMRGSATVRWVRSPEDTAGPPGMGIQFTELDEASQVLVDRMLQRKGASSASGAPVVTPSVPPVRTPAVAPIVPPVAPTVAPAVSPARGKPSAAPVASGILLDDQDEPLSFPTRTSITAVDIPIKGLEGLEGLDEPLVSPVSAPPPPAKPPLRQTGGMLEFDLADFSLEAAPEPVSAPQPMASASSQRGSAVEFELESSDDDEPLELARPVAGQHRRTSPRNLGAPSLSPEPKSASMARAAPSLSAEPKSASMARAAPSLSPEPRSASMARAAPPLSPEPRSASMARAAPPLSPEPRSASMATRPAPPLSPEPRSASMARAAPPLSPEPRSASLTMRPAPPLSPEPRSASLTARPAPLLSAEPKSTPWQVRTVFLTPPASLEGKGPVIGVDLGTSNSCVAVIVNNKPVVLRSREGYNTIPSVVSLSTQGKLLVSHRAKSQVLLRPEQTIYGAKRLVGRPFDSAVVNQVRERFYYEIVPDTRGRAAVRLGEHVLSLEEVQGIILRECKELAEQHLGQKVERAVVTVPAYYSEPQREAVRRAGWMAGLKVERILNEPTSAALAYGLNREVSKKVLVYDLGGGTFDATILNIDNNVFEVLATGGDIFLGGMDFDNVLVDLLLERFQQQERVSFQGDRISLSRVTDAAERAKVALSESNSYDVHIPMLMMDETGQPRDLHVTLTRAEMDAACVPLVMRTLDVVRDVLLDAKLRPGDIDDIILVGGQSRMPLVREKLKEVFGKSPHAGVNTDEAVALGAALYSNAVDKVNSVVLIDVLPMTIGVATPGGAVTRVIERNTPLPAQRSFAISTTRDDEEVMELSLFQGEDSHISANEYLGTVRLEGLPKGLKGSVRVAVTLRLDSECVLHVNAQEYSTRKEVKTTLTTRYTPEELRQRLGVAKDAAQAAEERRGQDLKARSGRFWGFLKKVVGKS